MGNVAAFFGIIIFALTAGAYLSARTIRALTRADQRMRCDVDDAAICSEADRAERGIYARWTAL